MPPEHRELLERMFRDLSQMMPEHIKFEILDQEWKQGYRKVGRPSAPVQEPTGADSKNPDFIARRSSPEFAVNRILTASSTLRWPWEWKFTDGLRWSCSSYLDWMTLCDLAERIVSDLQDFMADLKSEWCSMIGRKRLGHRIDCVGGRPELMPLL